MDRAAHGIQGCFRPEDEQLVLADREADRAGAAVAIQQRTNDEHAFVNLSYTCFAERVLGRFGDDHLIGLAVDHELPTAFMNVLAVLVLPDRQTPLLEEMDGGVHVTGDVGYQVLTGDAHEIVADVVNVVLQGVGCHPSAQRTG